MVEDGVATIVVLPTLIVAAVLPPTIVTLPAAIETSVLPATIVATSVVDPLSLPVVVVAEAAAELEPEPELAAEEPELAAVALASAADAGIERMLVVVGAEVGVRVVLPIN